VKLTDKQRRVLVFIAGFIARFGYPPTLRQIGKHVGNSVSRTWDYVEQLHVKHLLHVGHYQARAIRLTESSECFTVHHAGDKWQVVRIGE
jgi:SOS-response transcriptional repressor LexA